MKKYFLCGLAYCAATMMTCCDKQDKSSEPQKSCQAYVNSTQKGQTGSDKNNELVDRNDDRRLEDRRWDDRRWERRRDDERREERRQDDRDRIADEDHLDDRGSEEN
jgi:hypothetical protein